MVDLGTSGLRLTQTDTYVVGRESYTTTVSLANGSGVPIDAVVYRAGDCFVADSDFGTGHASDTSVACVSSSGRVEEWVPLTPGSSYLEAFYGDLWATIGSQQSFGNTCRCAETIDNSAGLSWPVHIPANGETAVSNVTAFSPDEIQHDRDGDGLLDDWETNGLDVNADGHVDVDLPAMGASPDHKDLFVEVDWMVRPQTCIWFICWGGRSFAPDQAALADVRNAFAAAPVGNPDGTNGIRLHIDSGPSSEMNPLTHATWGSRSRASQVSYVANLGTFSAHQYSWSAFNAIQAQNMDPMRADVFHYALFGDRYGGTNSSGIARATEARFAGDAFLLTGGAWSNGWTRRQTAGAFMHEFGHTLGLHHGGGGSDDGADLNYKPNYQSIMSYAYQMQDMSIDYSRATLQDLDENALDETAGLNGTTMTVKSYCADGSVEYSNPAQPIDWDCDGHTAGEPVRASINSDLDADGHVVSVYSVLRGHEDWSTLIYDGGAVGAFGAADLNDQDPPPTTTPTDEAPREQLAAAHADGGAGDGVVTVTGPTVLLANIAGQHVDVAVTNVSETTATYTLTVNGLPGAGAAQSITVLAKATSTVHLDVDGSQLTPGTLHVSASLTRTGVPELSRDDVDIRVPDMTNASTRDDARDAVSHLSGPVPGLDDAQRLAIVTALDAALQGPSSPPASSTPTAGPTATGNPSGSVTPPAPGTNGGMPTTGTNLTPFLAGGAGLLVTGVLMLVLFRARRRRDGIA